MKAVVVDINGRFAVVLDKKGSFVKIPNKGCYCIGHEIDVDLQKGFTSGMYRRFAGVAAVFVVVLGLGLGGFAYALPYSHVSIDVNPSIELTANRFDRIIGVRGLNADGTRLLASGDFKNRKLTAGLRDILKKANDTGYLHSDGDNGVMLTVSAKSDGKANKLEHTVKDNVAEELKQLGQSADLMVEKITAETRETAVKEGMSPGRQLLIESYMAANPSVGKDEAKKTPVRDMMKAFIEHKKESKEDSKKNNEKNGKKDSQDSTGKKPSGSSKNKGAAGIGAQKGNINRVNNTGTTHHNSTAGSKRSGGKSFEGNKHVSGKKRENGITGSNGKNSSRNNGGSIKDNHGNSEKSNNGSKLKNNNRSNSNNRSSSKDYKGNGSKGNNGNGKKK